MCEKRQGKVCFRVAGRPIEDRSENERWGSRDGGFMARNVTGDVVRCAMGKAGVKDPWRMCGQRESGCRSSIGGRGLIWWPVGASGIARAVQNGHDTTAPFAAEGPLRWRGVVCGANSEDCPAGHPGAAAARVIPASPLRSRHIAVSACSGRRAQISSMTAR